CWKLIVFRIVSKLDDLQLPAHERKNSPATRGNAPVENKSNTRSSPSASPSISSPLSDAVSNRSDSKRTVSSSSAAAAAAAASAIFPSSFKELDKNSPLLAT